MCSPAVCKVCFKTTWSGCGMHVASVKAMVPADQWCSGHPKSHVKTDQPRSIFGWPCRKDSTS